MPAKKLKKMKLKNRPSGGHNSTFLCAPGGRSSIPNSKRATTMDVSNVADKPMAASTKRNVKKLNSGHNVVHNTVQQIEIIDMSGENGEGQRNSSALFHAQSSHSQMLKHNRSK